MVGFDFIFQTHLIFRFGNGARLMELWNWCRYPIYRIPTGPTLKDLDACFLTFHSLSTPMRGTQDLQFIAFQTLVGHSKWEVSCYCLLAAYYDTLPQPILRPYWIKFLPCNIIHLESILLPNNPNTGCTIEACNLKELSLSSCYYKI